MSTWAEITDIEDLDISDDKMTLEVLHSSDDFGNHYIEIPIDMIRQKLKELDNPQISTKAQENPQKLDIT